MWSVNKDISDSSQVFGLLLYKYDTLNNPCVGFVASLSSLKLTYVRMNMEVRRCFSIHSGTLFLVTFTVLNSNTVLANTHWHHNRVIITTTKYPDY